MNFNDAQDIREAIWNDQGRKELVLEEMRTNPDFVLNYQGTQVRLDEEGNIYDYTKLRERGWSVNPEGQIYDVNTGRIVRNVNREEFIIGRV